jgi:hypothetical protein
MAHSPKLADKQGVGEFERKLIDKLHMLRYFIEENVESLMKENANNTDNSKNSLIMRNYEEWFDNEEILQELWNFEKNPNYIKFWTFPACSCPTMDNDDNYPHGHYVTSQKCIVHGWDIK